ncbi:hypothetical protein C8Q70DRAFT_106263 [Cubamyces menziesii]|nr:hypothetical protein C8Q70DRAFT_106263 [Cubamyces menziesii]
MKQERRGSRRLSILAGSTDAKFSTSERNSAPDGAFSQNKPCAARAARRPPMPAAEILSALPVIWRISLRPRGRRTYAKDIRKTGRQAQRDVARLRTEHHRLARATSGPKSKQHLRASGGAYAPGGVENTRVLSRIREAQVLVASAPLFPTPPFPSRVRACMRACSRETAGRSVCVRPRRGQQDDDQDECTVSLTRPWKRYLACAGMCFARPASRPSREWKVRRPAALRSTLGNAESEPNGARKRFAQRLGGVDMSAMAKGLSACGRNIQLQQPTFSAWERARTVCSCRQVTEGSRTGRLVARGLQGEKIGRKWGARCAPARLGGGPRPCSTNPVCLAQIAHG